MNQSEKIIVLSEVGIAPKDIADFLGAPYNSVTSVLSQKAKKTKSKKSNIKEG